MSEGSKSKIHSNGYSLDPRSTQLLVRQAPPRHSLPHAATHHPQPVSSHKMHPSAPIYVGRTPSELSFRPRLFCLCPFPLNAFIATALPSLVSNSLRIGPAVLVRTDAVVPSLQHRGWRTQPSSVQGQHVVDYTRRGWQKGRWYEVREVLGPATQAKLK